MENILVKEAMEVYMQDLVNTSNLYFLGVNTQSQITQKLGTNTILKAGFGDLPKALLQNGKEMDLSVQPLLLSENILAILSGSTATNGTATIYVNEPNLVVNGGKVTIKGTPVGTTVTLYDALGKSYTGTVATGDVTVTTPPSDGTIVTAVYQKSVTGNILNLDASNMPTAYKIYMHGIAYNADNNVPVADIYYVFSKAIPKGDLTMALSQNKETAPPIDFMLLTPVGSTIFGQYINVPRNDS